MEFKDKYLKYKKKYLSLKDQIGNSMALPPPGGDDPNDPNDPDRRKRLIQKNQLTDEQLEANKKAKRSRIQQLLEEEKKMMDEDDGYASGDDLNDIRSEIRELRGQLTPPSVNQSRQNAIANYQNNVNEFANIMPPLFPNLENNEEPEPLENQDLNINQIEQALNNLPAPYDEPETGNYTVYNGMEIDDNFITTFSQIVNNQFNDNGNTLTTMIDPINLGILRIPYVTSNGTTYELQTLWNLFFNTQPPLVPRRDWHTNTFLNRVIRNDGNNIIADIGTPNFNLRNQIEHFLQLTFNQLNNN